MTYLQTCLLLLAAVPSAWSSDLKIVCYYSNWAVYRPSLAKFTPQNINPYLCTHVIYAFAGFNKRYELKPYDPYNDIEQGNYNKFVGLKEYNPQLKTMIAVGGWNEGSKRFSHMVSERSQRQKFVRSAVKFCREHKFDGIDMDWEYPGFRDGGKPEDKQGYALLIKELREAFESESLPANKERLLLSVAMPAGKQYIDGGFDVKTVAKSADFLNLLTYDYHTAYEASTQHHSPLGARDELQEWDEEKRLNVRWTVDYYRDQGAPRDKLIVGIPTYGRSYTLADPQDTELDAAAEGPGEPGNSTREKGYLAYYEICHNVNELGWQVERPHPSLMGPYAFKDDQWVGFDDEQIIREKARYILREKLGGAMIWTLDNDDFRGNCDGDQSPLISALRKALLEQTDQDAVPRRRNMRRKKGRSPNHSTPAPPPTPDPGPAFECQDEGFFNNPRDCRKYLWCLDSGPANLGIVAHAFTCPSGLYFNSKSEACDYKENVLCRETPVEEGTTKKPRRSKARSTTTTTAAPTPAVTEEEDDKEDKDVAELLRLLKSIGGVDKLQSFLSGDEHRPTSTENATVQGQQIRRPQFQQEADLFRYVEPARHQQADDSAQQQSPFPFVYQTPERQEPQVTSPVTLPQQPTVPPFVYQTPARNLQHTLPPARDVTEPESSPHPSLPVDEQFQHVPEFVTPTHRPNKIVRVPGQAVPPGTRRGKRIRIRPAAETDQSSDTRVSGQRRVAIRRRPVISPPSEPLAVETTTTTTTTAPTTTPSTTTTATPLPTEEYDYEYEDTTTTTTTTTTSSSTTTKRPRRRPGQRKSHSSQVVSPVTDRFAQPLIVVDDQTVDCNKRGVFVHPHNCGKFVVCAPHSKSASGLRGYVHNCPAEQVYTEAKGRCMGGSRTTCQ